MKQILMRSLDSVREPSLNDNGIISYERDTPFFGGSDQVFQIDADHA